MIPNGLWPRNHWGILFILKINKVKEAIHGWKRLLIYKNLPLLKGGLASG
jgi:hypothetical protein